MHFQLIAFPFLPLKFSCYYAPIFSTFRFWRSPPTSKSFYLKIDQWTWVKFAKPTTEPKDPIYERALLTKHRNYTHPHFHFVFDSMRGVRRSPLWVVFNFFFSAPIAIFMDGWNHFRYARALRIFASNLLCNSTSPPAPISEFRLKLHFYYNARRMSRCFIFFQCGVARRPVCFRLRWRLPMQVILRPISRIIAEMAVRIILIAIGRITLLILVAPNILSMLIQIGCQLLELGFRAATPHAIQLAIFGCSMIPRPRIY